MKPVDAARNLFPRIYSTFTTKEDVLNGANIIDSILSKTPVWLLKNRGDEDAARLTCDTLSVKENLH